MRGETDLGERWGEEGGRKKEGGGREEKGFFMGLGAVSGIVFSLTQNCMKKWMARSMLSSLTSWVRTPFATTTASLSTSRSSRMSVSS